MRRGVAIAAEFLASIRAHAERVHPHECCGLIEGVVDESGWHVHRVHESRNAAIEPERHFLIDPLVQLRVMRELRGTGRDIIGCYHSHPSGVASPSEADRREAVDDDFVWLIVSNGGDIRAHVFAIDAPDFQEVEIAVSNRTA